MNFNPILARKHLMHAVERGMDLETGESIVHRPKKAKYEIRAIRRKRGIDLKWGPIGKFYDPYDRNDE